MDIEMNEAQQQFMDTLLADPEKGQKYVELVEQGVGILYALAALREGGVPKDMMDDMTHIAAITMTGAVAERYPDSPFNEYGVLVMAVRVREDILKFVSLDEANTKLQGVRWNDKERKMEPSEGA